MKHFFTLIACLALTVMLLPSSLSAQQPSTVTAQAVDPSIIKELQGHWQNDFKKPSTLYIKSIDPSTGEVKGTYKSPIGAGQVEFPLIGWINTTPLPSGQTGDHVTVVSFSVNWGDLGSVTAWNGTYTLDATTAKPIIVGQWLLSRTNSQFPFDHIVTGQDRYNKISDN